MLWIIRGSLSPKLAGHQQLGTVPSTKPVMHSKSSTIPNKKCKPGRPAKKHYVRGRQARNEKQRFPFISKSEPDDNPPRNLEASREGTPSGQVPQPTPVFTPRQQAYLDMLAMDEGEPLSDLDIGSRRRLPLLLDSVP